MHTIYLSDDERDAVASLLLNQPSRSPALESVLAQVSPQHTKTESSVPDYAVDALMRAAHYSQS